MEEAMADMPMNQRPRSLEPEQREIAVVESDQKSEQDPVKDDMKHQLVQGPVIKSAAKSNKPLWAISSGRGGKIARRVGRASWGMPVSEWTTLCGWHFAGANTRVELTRFKEFSIRGCQKCKGLFSLRDNVKGGVELAQLVEI